MDQTSVNRWKPQIEKARRRVTQWWDQKNSTPLVEMFLVRPGVKIPLPTDGWKDENEIPDIRKIVALQVEHQVDGKVFGGDLVPHFEHSYGAYRVAPMSLSFYYGAPIHFEETTTWTDHYVRDLDKFEPVLDRANRWWRYSLEISAEQHRQGQGVIQPCIPGIGDIFTNLSVMHGSDRLCLDLLDKPDRVHALRETMLRDWLTCYKSFADLGKFPGACPGTSAWSGWAEGTTYPVQCDFSTMISNGMFIEFVLPELEFLKNHISHMIWHLDGKEEFKHLDTLMGLPYIKAIQWPVPPNTTVDDPQWIRMYKEVQAAGRSLLLRGTLPQLRTLIDVLDPKGLRLILDGNATDGYLKDCERYLGATPW